MLDQTPNTRPPLTDAALRVAREYLGLTQEQLADILGVQMRTVRRWEAGSHTVPIGVLDQVERLEFEAAEVVTAYVRELSHDDAPAIRVYRSDEDYRAAEPDSRHPASWHRAIVARVAQEIDGLAITYS